MTFSIDIAVMDAPLHLEELIKKNYVLDLAMSTQL